MKLTGYRKRYMVVFVVGLVIANAYAFWPAFAYSNAVFNCPAILGPMWFEVTGDAQVVGPPLYSEMQMVMHPGSSAYEREVFESAINNLTRDFQYYQLSGSVTEYLSQINGFTGEEFQNQVGANQAGVTITLQNITYQGIHVAKIVSKIEVSSSANSASYELGGPPCRPGLILTVGSAPYAGPLAYQPAQLITVLICNMVGFTASAVSCIALTFYWKKSETGSKKGNDESRGPQT